MKQEQIGDNTIGGAQSLTRYTLSASPATGLIGMPENVLLQYFFECVDFLPFTSRR